MILPYQAIKLFCRLDAILRVSYFTLSAYALTSERLSGTVSLSSTGPIERALTMVLVTAATIGDKARAHAQPSGLRRPIWVPPQFLPYGNVSWRSRFN